MTCCWDQHQVRSSSSSSSSALFSSSCSCSFDGSPKQIVCLHVSLSFRNATHPFILKWRLIKKKSHYLTPSTALHDRNRSCLTTATCKAARWCLRTSCLQLTGAGSEELIAAPHCGYFKPFRAALFCDLLIFLWLLWLYLGENALVDDVKWNPFKKAPWLHGERTWLILGKDVRYLTTPRSKSKVSSYWHENNKCI